MSSPIELYPEDLWSVLEIFFKEVGLARQHLDSYDEFIEKGLQKIVDEVKEIPITLPEAQYSIRLGKVTVGAPRIIESSGAPHDIYPLEAKLRNLSYSSPISLEMSEIREKGPSAGEGPHRRHTCHVEVQDL